jgi:hypothetical protein
MIRPKLISINRSRRDLLNMELADNLDKNANCKLTKLVYTHNM